MKANSTRRIDDIANRHELPTMFEDQADDPSTFNPTTMNTLRTSASAISTAADEVEDPQEVGDEQDGGDGSEDEDEREGEDEAES